MIKLEKCPNCGYEMEYNENLDEITCVKCGTEFYPTIERND